MRLIAAALLALLLLASPALADDVSVERAWGSEDRAFAREDARLQRALTAWQRSDLRRSAPVVASLRRTEALVRRVERRVRRDRASSSLGRQARTAALSALRQYRLSTLSLRGAVVAASRGRGATARRLARRAVRQAEAAERATERGVALFRRARAQRPAPAEPAPSSPPSSPPSGQPSSPPPSSQGSPPPPPPEQQPSPPPPQDEPAPSPSPGPTLPPLPLPLLPVAA